MDLILIRTRPVKAGEYWLLPRKAVLTRNNAANSMEMASC